MIRTSDLSLEGYEENRSSGGNPCGSGGESLKHFDILLEQPDDLFIKPEDSGQDIDIWSKSKSIAPYSFVNPLMPTENLVG